MIPLFLDKNISFQGGSLLGEGCLYQEEENESYVYQMSEADWQMADREIGGKRKGVEILFWGERAPAETYEGENS